MNSTKTQNNPAITADQMAPTLNRETSSGKSFASFISILFSNLFTISIIFLLLVGWYNRDSNYITAESGAGYFLGIVGASLMGIVILYPLSKRTKLLAKIIPLRYWFWIHMMFGTVGPVMILYHSNFHMGSTNSSVALISMLLVAGSGLVGRYIYTHIHKGLYGKKLTLDELKQETNGKHEALDSISAIDETLKTNLNKIEQKALVAYPGFVVGIWHAIELSITSRSLQRRINKAIITTRPTGNEMQIKSVKRYMLVLRQTAAFRVYEQLFSLWHILHLPLFIMMIITAIVHIFAVHLY